MKFDFETFKSIAYKAYNNAYCPAFSFYESVDIFRKYFDAYEEIFNEVHPPLKEYQIQRLIERMGGNDGYGNLFEYEHYPPMIEQHFKTQYRNCDYNINHFFSGKIRELRFYEVVL